MIGFIYQLSDNLWYIVGIVLLIILFGAFLSVSYLKAPPDIAYIISGLRKGKDNTSGARIVVGRATIRIPFFERVDKLPLNLMQVDIKTNSAVPTAEYINVFIDGVANIKVASDRSSILRAAENFLGRKQAEVAVVAQQVLEGNMREIVGQMKLNELVQNRDLFASKVLQNAAEDMRRMGLEIVNLTVQNFTDKEGIIQDLGIDNIARIRKDAAIAKANAEKDIAVAQATAQEESNRAVALASINIAEQNKEVELKKSEYKRQQDIKKAEADAAYAIQEQEQRRSIETASVNADIARREKEIELQDKEISLTERTLDAQIKKQADAQKYAIEQKAQADKYRREQEAVAHRIELEQEAEAGKFAIEQKAIADKYQLEQQAMARRIELEQEAEAERFATEQKAQAEKFRMEQEAEANRLTAAASRYADEQAAAGIQAKGQAEADAILAKAEAMKAMGEASVLEMYLQTLPEMVKNAAAPLAQTEKIIMYGEGNSAKLVKDVMQSSQQIFDGLSESTGINVKEMLESFLNKQPPAPPKK